MPGRSPARGYPGESLPNLAESVRSRPGFGPVINTCIAPELTAALGKDHMITNAISSHAPDTWDTCAALGFRVWGARDASVASGERGMLHRKTEGSRHGSVALSFRREDSSAVSYWDIYPLQPPGPSGLAGRREAKCRSSAVMRLARRNVSPRSGATNPLKGLFLGESMKVLNVQVMRKGPTTPQRAANYRKVTFRSLEISI